MREEEKAFIAHARELAARARAHGDVPVGAIVVWHGGESDTGGGAARGGLNRGTAGNGGVAAGGVVSVGDGEADSGGVEAIGDMDGVLAGRGWRIVGCGYNTRERDNDPVGHAEIMALREAARTLGRWRLDDCDIYVNLEPCVMCAGAIVGARVRRLIFGAWDEKAGAAGSVRDVVRDARLNHQVEVIGGVDAEECARDLRAFFGR